MMTAAIIVSVCALVGLIMRRLGYEAGCRETIKATRREPHIIRVEVEGGLWMVRCNRTDTWLVRSLASDGVVNLTWGSMRADRLPAFASEDEAQAAIAVAMKADELSLISQGVHVD